MKNGKELVKAFFETAFNSDPDELKNFLHPDVTIYWNSSSGFYQLNFDKFSVMAQEMGKSFESMNCDITHLLQEGDTVTIRFTYYVNTIEHPDEDIPMAHFMVIWELKEDKLFNGYIISQPDDDSPENISSFIPKKE